MKVSSDAITLGAWAPIDGAKQFLDIGTGSGILALMLAQRSAASCHIDAIEYEYNAYQQAEDNFQHSPWPHKLTAIYDDILRYSQTAQKRYDVIISNPPYFPGGSACRTRQRAQARYLVQFTHEQLLQSCQKLLNKQGRVILVLPFAIAQNVLNSAVAKGWFIGRQLLVHDNQNKPAHLLLFELARIPLLTARETLYWRDNDRQYSQAFRQLAKAFYLAF